jgi:hypothetical protein
MRPSVSNISKRYKEFCTVRKHGRKATPGLSLKKPLISGLALIIVGILMFGGSFICLEVRGVDNSDTFFYGFTEIVINYLGIILFTLGLLITILACTVIMISRIWKKIRFKT